MSHNTSLISIILPTYNEKHNIVPLVQDIHKYLHKYPHEIIVIDDNSPDKTARMAEELTVKIHNLRVYIRKKSPGLALSILDGIKKSKGTYIIIMDTDFNHDPKDLTRFLDSKDSFDIVVGSRYRKGGGMQNKIRYLLSYIYNICIRLILGLKTTDNLSGFFLIRKSTLALFDVDRIFIGYGDYFIRLLKAADKKNIRIVEIPIYYKNRKTGQSKSRFLRMFLDYSKTVIDILIERPI